METKRNGKCINFGNCAKADRQEIIELDITEDFLCPECNGDLEETIIKPAGPNKLLIGIIAAVVVFGGGIGAYFAMNSGKKEIKPEKIEDVQAQQMILVSSLSLNKTSLDITEKGTAQLTLGIQPDDATNKSVEWSSSDASVATVDEKGMVTAVKEGAAVVSVQATDESNQKASCSVTVNKGGKVSERPQPQGGGNDTTGTGSGTVKVPGGTYKGELKNGKPDGSGTITYSAYTRISAKDLKERYANAGDYVTGQFRNGEVVQVKWYNADGSFNQTIMP